MKLALICAFLCICVLADADADAGSQASKVCGWEQACSFACNVEGDSVGDAQVPSEKDSVGFDFDVHCKCRSPTKALYLLEVTDGHGELKQSPRALFLQDRSSGKIERVVTPKTDSVRVQHLKMHMIRLLSTPLHDHASLEEPERSSSTREYSGKDAFGQYHAQQTISHLGHVGYLLQANRKYRDIGVNCNTEADIDEDGSISAVKESWKDEEGEVPSLELEIQRIGTRHERAMFDEDVSDAQLQKLIDLHVGESQDQDMLTSADLEEPAPLSAGAEAVLEKERALDHTFEAEGKVIDDKALGVWGKADALERRDAARLQEAEYEELRGKQLVKEFMRLADAGHRGLEGLQNNWARLQRDGQHEREGFQMLGGTENAFKKARASAARVKAAAEADFARIQKQAHAAIANGRKAHDEELATEVDNEATERADKSLDGEE